ncbi:MAG TPA: DUF2849 domain-containing protein [Polyangiaceae bacterium]|jgi:hypothetical protein|nr:DUF2849 domain-containing protein [Polyangiaceae bacterium]
MPKPQGSHWVITGGYTDDGAPAFLRSNGSWSRKLSEAWTIEGAGKKDEALAAAQKNELEVCDAYAIQVGVGAQGIDPLSARETIRANGPTVPYRRPDTATH